MSVEPLEAERLAARRRYLRPIVVATAFSWVAELWLLLFYGVYLSDEGSLLYKIIWTLGFCGLGMGLALGALIDVLLVDRVSPRTAVWSTATLSFATLGVACNLLCMFLDRHFRYFGGAEDPILHFAPSLVASALAGWLAGWLLFTERGNAVLDRIGI